MHGEALEKFRMSNEILTTIDRATYLAKLRMFDEAICEAIAVSQASANRMAAQNWGYASYVFTHLCGAGTSLITAAPLTRWVQADFNNWQFGAIAGHARSLFDGYLLFTYLIEPAETEAEVEARVCVMHLNDCIRRIELHTDLELVYDFAKFEGQRQELADRLNANAYFSDLPPSIKKNCLSGKFLMIDSRDERLAKIGLPKGHFDALYDLWSQHIHILPLSFYRIEPNGRGTGIENETDRAYMAQALDLCANLLIDATDSMVAKFPDTASVRRGTNSEFSPGPRQNRPRNRKASAPSANSTMPEQSSMSVAIKSLFLAPPNG